MFRGRGETKGKGIKLVYNNRKWVLSVDNFVSYCCFKISLTSLVDSADILASYRVNGLIFLADSGNRVKKTAAFAPKP